MADLKTRVQALEAQVAELQSALARVESGSNKDWRRAVDKYAGGEGLLAVFEEGRKLREADRAKARRRRPRRAKA